MTAPAYLPGTDRVVRVRAALVASARYDTQRRDWAGADRLTITGVAVQPVSSTEATLDREYAATHLRVYAPAGADVCASDRIEWRSVTYEVDGEPGRWLDDATDHHVEFAMKRMTG